MIGPHGIPSIEDVVLGHVLDDRRTRRGGAGTSERLGSTGQRARRALTRNATTPRSFQSVVKRVKTGSTRTPQELRRLLDYVAREEGVKATWCNLAGYDRDLAADELGRIVDTWSSTWRGAPQRGHTDHIIVSFPRGVSADVAETIAREWGQAVFGSGDFGDVWRYVAAVHQDTDYAHAHFVVDKHGIDLGRFMSISMKAELNYDVMRELHAEISQSHGINITASSRLSRGIIENAPRETDVRAAHASGRAVSPQPMSDEERVRREVVVRGFAAQYEDLGRIARLTAGQGTDDDGFMARLASALANCANQMMKGLPLMPDTSLHPGLRPGADAAQRFEAAKGAMVEAAKEAWEEIRGMEPSAEKTELEMAFARQARAARDIGRDDPFLAAHARVVERSEDPYFHTTVASLGRVEATVGETTPIAGIIAHVRDELEERLKAVFSLREDDLRGAGTSVQEMAARHLAPERTEGQLATWRAADTPLASVTWLELERDISKDAARIIGDYEVPRDLREVIARDQLLTAERHTRLADVPAIEALVDRVQERLSKEELALITSGDPSPLRSEIKDPALRAAVASELKNEADLGSDPTSARRSEPVASFQDLARSQDRAVEQRDRPRERDLSDSHEL